MSEEDNSLESSSEDVEGLDLNIWGDLYLPQRRNRSFHGIVIVTPQQQLIYTDWANHYLEKARNKRYISDLQQDVSDGVLLADVIEAVTNEKILDIKTKPKNSAQMVENINTCLTFLSNLGVNVEGLNAKDIKDGNLKSILSLFFNLSRYKQQQKSQQQHKDQHQRPHPGEATNTNQTNGDDVQSRLPSYKQQNSKCLISAHSGTSVKDGSNSTTGCSKSSSGGNNSGSGSKGRSQLSAQNNNLPSTAGADPETTTSSRATSPACSGIPTPGGRGLTSRNQEKQQSRTTQSQSSNSSIPTPSKSSSPKSGSSFTSGSANKNSMLDKFKLFNSKDKGKSKGGSSKGLSKASSSASSASAPSTSSRSDTDSKSSTSLQSSSSTDPGASLSPQDGEPPKLPAKTKSSAFTGPKRENSGLTVPPEPTIRQGSPSFGVSSSTTGSLSSTKKSLSAKSQKNDSKAAPVDAKSAAQSSSSTQSLTRPPKVGSLIPKTSLRTSKSSSSSSLSSQGALGSGIPTPTSSIPKPATAKVSKPSKEEKMKAISNVAKEQDRNGNNMQSIQNQSIPVTKKSSKSMQGMAQQQQAQQVMLQQQQQMAHLQQQQHPPPVPPHRNNGNKAAQFTSCSDHSISQTRPQTPQEQLSRLHDGRSTFPKTRYTEIEYSDGKIERVGEGHLSKSSQAAAMSQVMDLHGATIPQKVSASHPAYHLVTTASQSVNVVKPTCSTAYNPVMKADGNTQTALTVLHRGNRPPPLPTTEPPPSRHKKLESPKECKAQSDANTSDAATHFANSSSSGNNSASSSETEAAKTGTEEKLEPAEVSSPRLGVKALVPQIGRPANNVAIVQPRHGEKIETTFDTEVRTEMINKGNVSKDGKQGKETTFSEKKATFVDDSGETMDIQPMAPIMRATPYGYYRSISSQSSNAKHYQTPVVTLPSGTYALATTAGSRLGMSRTIVDQGRFYSGPIKRAMSSGSGSVPFDTDYSSDYDTYDYISGYMSDGDILKRNNMDDMTSGYMSEGGASMYARRLQQRFREGMQAVKECMQKSRGLIDDDSFDDSSSISSGDISDTINEISTDEGNLTGGSSQSDTNPYAGLKHGPRDLFRNLTNENLHGVLPGKRVPNLGTSAFMGTDYASDSGGGYGGSASGWRKYSLQNNRLLSSDPADYAYLYNGYDSMQWRNQDGSRPLRKLSNASQPEIHYRSASTNGDYAGEHVSDSSSLKRDSETNTDQSHLYEASLRKLHSIQSPRLQSGGSVGYLYRRPLSNVSTSSVGSNRSSGGSKGSSSVGTRLAMYSNTTSKLGSEHNGVLSHAGTPQNVASNKESGPDAYVSASLERNKKGGNPVSKSSSSAQTDADMYKSNSLGRRKGIGVKAPLMKTAAGENGNICGSTIISNPHATFSKGDPRGQPSPYSSVNIPGISGSSSTGNYVSLEYVRGMGPAWLRTSGGNISNYGVHSPYGHLSDSETIDGLSAYASSIQAQIQQARALSGASARILAQQRGEYGQSGGLQRSNSMRSTQSDSVYASFQHCHTDDLAMTNSYSQLPSPPPPSSPTPSNSSHASSRFTFPMTTYNSSTAAAINPSPSQNMVRSNTSNSLPYGNMGLAKLNKEDEESLHGSSLSLVSSSSSVYSTAEEKQNHEIRKLKRDLEAAQEKVSTLTTQLSTNVMSIAFVFTLVSTALVFTLVSTALVLTFVNTALVFTAVSTALVFTFVSTALVFTLVSTASVFTLTVKSPLSSFIQLL
ncbi:hypothetical protein ACJMK2_027830 [Sinanodonta woodiana]|uniref:Calponin-homology (CH) domain-containing protein n=1 Tax=Sinanodonta woodiana TaxID=1069815 RepID=A0ABD3X5Q7_SINWO